MLVSVYGRIAVEGLVEPICLSLVWPPSLQTILALLKIGDPKMDYFCVEKVLLYTRRFWRFVLITKNLIFDDLFKGSNLCFDPSLGFYFYIK